MRFELELAQYEQQIFILRQMGLITQEQASQFQDLVVFMKDNPPDWETLFGEDLEAALDPLRDLLADMQESDPRITTQERFESAQSRFRSLLARAQAGDIEAIRELASAGSDYREQILAYLGQGGSALPLLDEIETGLRGLVGDVSESHTPVVAELETSNRYLEEIARHLGASTPRPRGTDGAAERPFNGQARSPVSKGNVVYHSRGSAVFVSGGRSTQILEQMRRDAREAQRVRVAERRQAVRANAAFMQQNKKLIELAEAQARELTLLRKHAKRSEAKSGRVSKR